MKVDTSALRAECEELAGLLTDLVPGDWDRRTTFYGWSIADEVMHLAQVDGFGRVAVEKPGEFPPLLKWVRDGQANGIELSQRMREEWGDLEPGPLFDVWQSG